MKVTGITEIRETRRQLETMPFDRMVELSDGNQTLAHATGFEVCFGDTANLADWWNEYQTPEGEICYGR